MTWKENGGEKEQRGFEEKADKPSGDHPEDNAVEGRDVQDWRESPGKEGFARDPEKKHGESAPGHDEGREQASINQPQEDTDGGNMLLKIVLPLLILLLAAASVYHYVHDRDRGTAEVEEEERVEKPLVKAVQVQTHSLEKSTSLVGTVEPADERLIIPEMGGEVERVHVEEGERVEKGQLLIELEAGDYELQLEEARSVVRAARAQLEEAEAGPREGERAEAEAAVEMAGESKEQAKKELERTEELYEEGFASSQQVEMAELEYTNAKEQLKSAEAALDTLREGARREQLDALQAQVEQAQTAVRLAERRLERTRIEAPTDGTVAVVEVEEGEMADVAAPSAILIDTENMQVSSALPEAYVNQLEAGDAVSVEIPSVREDPFHETIQRIGELPPGEGGRSYPLEVALSGEDVEEGRIKAGMFARLDVTVIEREEVLAVPRRALVEGEEEMGLYTIVKEEGAPENETEAREFKRGTVEFTTIKTGMSEDGWVEVKEGLEKGSRVVVDGQEEVSPGDEVRIEGPGEDEEEKVLEEDEESAAGGPGDPAAAPGEGRDGE